MSGGGKTGDNKWIKWSKSQVDAENGDDYDVTLYDVWVNPKDGEQFYKIERIDGEDDYVVMGELGDMGEELIEEYSTLAKARARAKELVRIAESGKKMSGGGKIPTNVMTLKEWVENTDLDEVGKYVKSKLKKPETQIYVIGEEDDYAVTIDTDWKEDKPLTDEEGSEHTLYIGKGVVEVDTDGAFTNTFFTKDANSTITKKYDD